jgi:hypothetical protein
LGTRQVDTIAALRNALAKRFVTARDQNGRGTITSYVNPMLAGDEWALLSDGTIAIVRGHDYHVDWISPDGAKSSTAKLPFDWKRLSDADKMRVRDSAVAAAALADSIIDARIRAAMSSGNPNVMVGRGGGGDPSGASQLPKRVTSVVPIDSLPDYYPPVRPNAARGDRDGLLWILPSTSAQSLAGELVYDVVNRTGEMIYRVRVPAGRSIAGFGPGGVVFLLNGSIAKGFTLERTRVSNSGKP